MTNLYFIFLKNVENGARFDIDLKNKSMRVGKKNWLIKDGIYSGDISTEITGTDVDVLQYLTELYEDYKVSVPTRRSRRRKPEHFKALDISELSQLDLIQNADRRLAKAHLEAFTLCSILNGDLEWSDEWGGWFYRNPDNNGLILLKEWF